MYKSEQFGKGSSFAYGILNRCAPCRRCAGSWWGGYGRRRAMARRRILPG